MDAVEYLKANVNIRDLLTLYGAKRVKQNYNEIRCCCPIHGGNNETAFVFNIKNGLWFCHTGCKIGGDIFDFVQRIEHLETFQEAVNALANKFGLDITDMEIKQRANEILLNTKRWIEQMKNVLNTKRDTEFALENIGSMFPINSYRNFDKAILNEYGIKYCLENKRIVIPIIHNKTCVGATMRRTTNETVKWLHKPQGLITGNYLFNIDNIELFTPILIVEGIWDVLNAVQHGYLNTVGTFGAHLTQEQSNIILRSTHELIIGFDPDVAGRIATKNVIEMLQNKINIKIMDVPVGKDVGILNSDELNNCFANLKNIYEWRTLYGR